MRRVKAILFVSAIPVRRDDLARVVRQGASVDLLAEDLGATLEGRSFEVGRIADGWMLRTHSAYAPVVSTVADVGDQLLRLSAFDVAVFAAIAWHHPIATGSRASGPILNRCWRPGYPR
jgi:chromosome segregation and condensation protein ScpB